MIRTTNTKETKNMTTEHISKPVLAKMIQLVSKHLDKSVHDIESMWSSKTPHFGGQGPHRYGQNNLCEYCMRPNWLEYSIDTKPVKPKSKHNHLDKLRDIDLVASKYSQNQNKIRRILRSCKKSGYIFSQTTDYYLVYDDPYPTIDNKEPSNDFKLVTIEDDDLKGRCPSYYLKELGQDYAVFEWSQFHGNHKGRLKVEVPK